MAIGAYATGLLVVGSTAGRLLAALPAGIALAVLRAVLVGMPSLRLRSDYFAIATIAFGEIVRYIAAERRIRRRQPGRPRLRRRMARLRGLDARGCRPGGLGRYAQLPLLCAVWLTCSSLSVSGQGAAAHALGPRPARRSAKTRMRPPRSARTCSPTSCSRSRIAAALAAVAGFFVALNVTYLYPSVFDPTFTFFGYAILVLGGFATTRA